MKNSLYFSVKENFLDAEETQALVMMNMGPAKSVVVFSFLQAMFS